MRSWETNLVFGFGRFYYTLVRYIPCVGRKRRGPDPNEYFPFRIVGLHMLKENTRRSTGGKESVWRTVNSEHGTK